MDEDLDLVKCFCIDHGVQYPKRDRVPHRCLECNREVEPCKMENIGPYTDAELMHEASQATRRPAPKSVIDQMKELEMTEDMSKRADSCPICTDPMEVGTTVKAMECGHFFHGHCIVKWLEQRNACPLCEATLLQKYPVIPKYPVKDKRPRGDGGDGASSSSCA